MSGYRIYEPPCGTINPCAHQVAASRLGQENKKLKEENDSLKAFQDGLLKGADEIRCGRDKLIDENVRLKAENERLTKAIDEMRCSSDAWYGRCKELYEELSRLKEDMEQDQDNFRHEVEKLNRHKQEQMDAHLSQLSKLSRIEELLDSGLFTVDGIRKIISEPYLKHYRGERDEYRKQLCKAKQELSRLKKACKRWHTVNLENIPSEVMRHTGNMREFWKDVFKDIDLGDE